jgi:sugar lactone lactonase YvrE
MDWTFELLAGPYGGTTEGPAWDGQALLFTHIPGSRIMRYDPNTGTCTEFRTGTHGTNGLMFDAGAPLRVPVRPALHHPLEPTAT